MKKEVKWTKWDQSVHWARSVEKHNKRRIEEQIGYRKFKSAAENFIKLHSISLMLYKYLCYQPYVCITFALTFAKTSYKASPNADSHISVGSTGFSPVRLFWLSARRQNTRNETQHSFMSAMCGLHLLCLLAIHNHALSPTITTSDDCFRCASKHFGSRFPIVNFIAEIPPLCLGFNCYGTV